eukprot:2674174-Pyramimonas_sp.AAC.1
MGCPQTSQTCAHAHEAITGMGGLHSLVQAQLVKRGGLKSGTRVEPKDAGGRAQQLRAQAKSED